jgi:hypothetical protein
VGEHGVQNGTKHTPLEGPVLNLSMAVLLLYAFENKEGMHFLGLCFIFLWILHLNCKKSLINI